jgi:hypothetical protein
MKIVAIVLTVAGAGLAACSGPVRPTTASDAHGRYASAGTYPAGRMWSQMAAAPAPKDAAAARLGDDEQIIVVLDSQTGELRQCGNVSGYCVAMNPWSKPPGATPAALAKHADQLDAEAKAKPAQPSAGR